MTTSDLRGRPLQDLHLSVTGQGNWNCPCCMPQESLVPDFPFIPAARRLSFGQLARLARVFVWLGVEKIRLTVLLDSLDGQLAGRMNGVGFPVARVLEGIEEAQRVGLAPVQVIP